MTADARPLIVNDGEPIRDLESLRLVLRSMLATLEGAAIPDGLVEALLGRPDLLTSETTLTTALRAMITDELASAPDSVDLKRLLHAVLTHEVDTAENRTAYLPAHHANPSAVRWPDPSDPENPRHIADELPYAHVDACMDKTTPIGYAGGSFAAAIGERLRADGYDDVVAGASGDGRAPWGRLLNAPALRQFVECAFGLRTLPKLLWSHENQDRAGAFELRDPFAEETVFDSVEAYEASRERLLVTAREALTRARVFVLTLDTNEVWRLRADGAVLAGTPSRFATALVDKQVLTVEDNVRELQRLLDAWRPHNPELKLVVGVSPEPMAVTFRGDHMHVAAATCHAKSVLRVAAEEFAARNRDVFYFPAYEAVTYCTEGPWAPDQRHVSRAALAKVMRLFERMFVREEPLTRDIDTTRTLRFLLEPEELHRSGAAARAIGAYVEAFTPQDDTCLILWLDQRSGRSLDETERAVVDVVEAAGHRIDKVPEILIMEGARGERDAVLRQVHAVLSTGAASGADLVATAREARIRVVEADAGTLRDAFDDALELEALRVSLPALRTLAERAAADHPQRASIASAVDTFVDGYRQFAVTRRTPTPAYGSMRHLFFVTDGKFNDGLQALYGAVHPPYVLPAADGILGRLSEAQRAAILSELATAGFTVFPGLLPKETCDRLVRWALTTPCSPQSPPAPSPAPVLFDRTRPQSVKCMFPESTLLQNADVRRFVTDLSLLAVGQAQLGCKPVLSHLNAWWSAPSPKGRDSYAAQLYHSDMDKPNFLNVFVYLTDVTAETGPHCFVRGSHRGKPLALRRDGRISDAEVDAHYAREDVVEIVGPAGTVIIANSRGLHKGKEVCSGDRLMMNLTLASSLFGAPYATVGVDAIADPEFHESRRTYRRTYARYQDA